MQTLLFLKNAPGDKLIDLGLGKGHISLSLTFLCNPPIITPHSEPPTPPAPPFFTFGLERGGGGSCFRFLRTQPHALT